MSLDGTKIKKSLTWMAGIIPLVMLLGAAAFWIDARYMHRQISDSRFIDLQVRVVELQVADIEYKMDIGEDLTTEEKRKYEVYMDQLQNLMNERNRLLGIGE